jgi:hypothetical protein
VQRPVEPLVRHQMLMSSMLTLKRLMIRNNQVI